MEMVKSTVEKLSNLKDRLHETIKSREENPHWGYTGEAFGHA